MYLDAERFGASSSCSIGFLISPRSTRVLSAKVSIVEFADFQCPFCDIFFREVEAKLVTKYVDTGLAKLTYMDFAFLGQESKDAANAAKCAQEQGKFWEYHDKLYSSQKGENKGTFKKANLLSFGKSLSLDMAKFTPCVTNDTYAFQVEDETSAGRRIGVTGTPTVIINGKMIVGAQDISVFEQAIDAALGQ
jgi:protein-disulfide isomerase